MYFPIYSHSTSEDTPEEFSDQEFSEDEDDDDDESSEDTVTYKTRHLMKYKGQQANIRAANGNEAIHATPDKPRVALNTHRRGGTLPQAAAGFVARTSELSTNAANALMAIQATSGENRQTREEEKEQLPRDEQGSNDDDGDDGNDERNGGTAPTASPTTQTASFVDPHFATDANPRIVSQYEQRGDGTRTEKTNYYQN